MNNSTRQQQSCISEADLEMLGRNEFSERKLEQLEGHLTSCGRCREKLDAIDEQPHPQWHSEIRPAIRETFVVSQSTTHVDETPSHERYLKLLTPSDDPAMLGRIGIYEVAGIIGQGGMGVVFKAFEPALNRFVAIKMLLPHLTANGAARKRFLREAQAAAAVVDDHVLPIFGVDQWQEAPYLVMKYSSGQTLEQRIAQQGPLAVNEVLRIGLQAAKGLAAAHAQGLVHRDVKPSNILLDGSVDRAVLMDFGLARTVNDASVTRTGIVSGTPQYMSPEQVRADFVDTRSDLFSLGSVMYAMCTGRVPFRADSSYAVMRQITDNDPRPIRQLNTRIPQWLCSVIDRLMAKEADDRFESAAEVADLLERCIAHVQQPDDVPLPVAVNPQVEPSDERVVWNWKWKCIAAVCFGGLISLAMLAAAKRNPPDIAGVWTGADWGDVALIHAESGAYTGEYSGKYTGGAKRGPGTIEIEWSRREKRYVGQWQADSGERGGNLSIHLLDKEIRGAWSQRRRKNDGDQRKFTDLAWARSQTPASPTQFTEIQTNFSRLHQALNDYYADHETFPPSEIHTEGKPPHSWRVSILPYLGERALYDRYHFDEPWDSEHNRTLLAQMPKAYRSPLDQEDSTNASYFGMVNQRRHVIPFSEYEKQDSEIRYWFPEEKAVPIGLSFFGKHEGVPISYMQDDAANIIALVEARQPIPWTKPMDLEFSFDDPSPLKEIPTWFRDGWYVAYADGGVDFLRSQLKPTQLRELFSTWESPDSGFTLREYRKHSPDWNLQRLKNLAAPPASSQATPGAVTRMASLLGLIGEPEPTASMQNITKHSKHGVTTGFRITGIVDGSPAAKEGLEVEDILLGIERWETGSVEDVEYAINHAQLQKLDLAQFYVVSDGKTYYGKFDLHEVPSD